MLIFLKLRFARLFPKMRRKLIKQGVDGLTLYVPKKWADKRSLKAGDEVEISENNDLLIISPSSVARAEKVVELKFEKGRENALRMLLVNSYRVGYDKIILDFPGDKKFVEEIVTNFLMGFELFEKDKGLYSIESVAEPNYYDDFEKIIQRLFNILIEILKNIDLPDVKEQAKRVQKYDNFLKRSLSKSIFIVDTPLSFWQFLSNLVHVSRQAYHMNRHLKGPLSKKEKAVQTDLVRMMEIMRHAYTKKDLYAVMELHEIEEKISYTEGHEMLKGKNAQNAHYLISIARAIYIGASPLVGILEAAKEKKD